MALTLGTRLGPYEVTALIGAGGMGRVYRARDTHLDRDVALKVLPDAFTGDPERLARFEREAKVLASLNHPHIAQIYGLEHAVSPTGAGPAVQALVMEFVEGDDLSQRIARGPMPLDETLPIARQIAEALEAAHEQGIIHRDLKPANIKVRADGTVKVLDFGLAKALDPAEGSGPAADARAHSSTITSPAETMRGAVLGTAAYMSPEQARGKPVDRRTDIWAFGCVSYEMLTGRRAFPGEDFAEILAAVVRSEPDWSALHDDLPAGLKAYLRRCFQKDPKQRVQSIGDVRLALDGAFDSQTRPPTGQAAARHTGSLSIRWTVAASLGAGIVGAVFATLAPWSSSPQRPALVVRFSMTPGESERIAGTDQRAVAISPDGSRIAFLGLVGQRRLLFVRPLNSLDATTVEGTDGARNPFFSADGRWIGFYLDRRLMKVSIERSGAPVVAGAIPALDHLATRDMALLESNPFGISWGVDDAILVGLGSEGIWRVPAAGGPAESVVSVEPGEWAHGPQLLPDGESVLYTLRPRGTTSWDDAEVVVQSLKTGARQVVVERGRDARYVSTGHVVYGVEGGLSAIAYDARTHRVTSAPGRLVDGVGFAAGVPASGAVQYDVSDNGTLVYAPGAGTTDNLALLWVDRQGHEAPIALPAKPYGIVRVSPEGSRAAMSIFNGANWDIWTAELERGTLSPLVTSPADEISPLWTRDGNRVVFASGQESSWGFYQRAADGTGPVERVIGFDKNVSVPSPSTWSPDGRLLAFEYYSASTGSFDIGLLSFDGTPSWKPLVSSEHEEGAPVIAPNGRWMAYSSFETGQRQVWIQRFPDLGDRRLVSTGRGMDAVWSADGRTLFFRGGPSVPPSEMTAVPITYDPALSIGPPTVLFDRTYYRTPEPIRRIDLSPTDGRFLMLASPTATAAEGMGPRWESLIVVQNWFEELKARVPGR